ncbi:MAG: hypothetical protein QM820_26480 [Minicystis sp.]
MFHTFESAPTTVAGLLGAPADPMSAALRALALSLGPDAFPCLSARASRRLSFACNGFAALLGSGEDIPEKGASLRARAWFLVTALQALRDGSGEPLSTQEEAWMIGEIEADFGEAVALLQTHRGQPCSPIPARPAPPSAGRVVS